MRRVLALVWLAGLSLLAASADAQPRGPGRASAVVTMSADRTRMEVGEIFRLTVEARVTGAGNTELVLPGLDAFDILSRQVSTPFSLRFGFGRGTQQVQSTIRHVLTLRARQVGRVTLPAAYVEIEGQRYASNTLTFEIGGAPGDPRAGSPATAPSPQGIPPGNSVDGMRFESQGFLRTWVDEGQPYLGQQVTVTVYLYIKQPLRGSPQITQEPTTDGFWVQDLLQPSRTLTPRTQALNGQSFQVYLLRRFAAFPLQTGDLTIGPPALTIQRGGGIFAILGGGNQPSTQTLTGEPVTIRVRPHPEAGRPPGHAHVGSLELHAELDRSHVATGDAVTLTLNATGRGAMQQLRVPDPEVDGLRVLAPEVRDTLSTPNDVVGGTRTIRWLVVPERPGTYSLGPFEVPVLNPLDGTWSVARVPALELVAAGNLAQAETPADEPADRRQTPNLPSEVTFGPVHTHSALSRTHASFTAQPWFLSLLGLGPLAFLLGLGVRSARRRAARGDPKGAPKRARKAAHKRLATAKQHATAEQPREFYASVAGALKDLLEAKLARPVGSLTHVELHSALVARGMDDELATKIVDELEGCDFARFSAVGVSSKEMDSCLDRARELLRGLDRFTPTPLEST